MYEKILIQQSPRGFFFSYTGKKAVTRMLSNLSRRKCVPFMWAYKAALTRRAQLLQRQYLPLFTEELDINLLR